MLSLYIICVACLRETLFCQSQQFGKAPNGDDCFTFSTKFRRRLHIVILCYTTLCIRSSKTTQNKYQHKNQAALLTYEIWECVGSVTKSSHLLTVFQRCCHVSIFGNFDGVSFVFPQIEVAIDYFANRLDVSVIFEMGTLALSHMPTIARRPEVLMRMFRGAMKSMPMRMLDGKNPAIRNFMFQVKHTNLLLETARMKNSIEVHYDDGIFWSPIPLIHCCIESLQITAWENPLCKFGNDWVSSHEVEMVRDWHGELASRIWWWKFGQLVQHIRGITWDLLSSSNSLVVTALQTLVHRSLSLTVLGLQCSFLLGGKRVQANFFFSSERKACG